MTGGRRPRLLFGMRPELPRALLDEALMARLADVADIQSPDAVEDLHGRELDGLLAETDVVFGCWGCPVIDADVLARAPRLRLVAYATASVKYFVTPAMWARGVVVTSAHLPMAVPVAEFTLAAILFCGKDTFRFIERHRQSRGRIGTDTRASWNDMRIGNNGKRVGIVGASRIGRLVIEMLARFDMVVRVYDPFLSDEEARALGVERSGLRELMAWADIVSLHAPAVPATRNMIGAEELAAMRDHAYLINTARGWLVDGAALERELATGRINAFIDTPLPDPLPPESPLYDMPNVVLSPHLAGSQGNELRRMAALAVDEVERFAAGLPPLHPVSEAELDRTA